MRLTVGLDPGPIDGDIVCNRRPSMGFRRDEMSCASAGLDGHRSADLYSMSAVLPERITKSREPAEQIRASLPMPHQFSI